MSKQRVSMWPLRIQGAVIGLAGFAGLATADVTIQRLVEQSLDIRPSPTYEPAIDGDTFVFIGSSRFERGVIFRSRLGGDVEVVVTTEDDVPDGTGTFRSFTQPSLDGQNISFHAFRSPPARAVFSIIDGDLQRASRYGRWNFLTDISGSTVAFADLEDGRLYANVANQGARTVIAVGAVLSNGDRVLEIGQHPETHSGAVRTNLVTDGISGFYEIDIATGTETLLFDRNIEIPGGDGVFRALGRDAVVSNGDDIAFVGDSSSGVGGIYARINGEVQVLIDTTMDFPGTESLFRDPCGRRDLVGISEYGVVFRAESEDDHIGLFLYQDGELQTIVSTLDTLDGLGIVRLNLGRESIDGFRVVFSAELDGGTGHIYMALIPAPGTSQLFLLGVAVMMRRSRSTTE